MTRVISTGAVIVAMLPLLVASRQTAQHAKRLECAQQGGEWKTGDVLGDPYPFCLVTYADGGTPCTSSDQCGGACFRGAEPYTPSNRTEGICAYDNNIFGCWLPVEQLRGSHMYRFWFPYYCEDW
jgi:hypothetical protein